MSINSDQHEENATFLTQVVFPINDTFLSFNSHAFLVGWNIENFRCCIIAAFEEPSERYVEVKDAISRTLEPLASVYATCSPNGLALPTILGGKHGRLNFHTFHLKQGDCSKTYDLAIRKDDFCLSSFA